MKIESEDVDVQSFLGSSFFTIPRFQRPYSWESEHIAEFWDDLVQNQNEEYFIGSMVLFRRGKQQFGVVDGQQRLTTITILLCVLRDAFERIGELKLAKGLHLLVERKNIDNDDTPVLKTETSFPYLQDKIQRFGKEELDIVPSAEELRLSQSYLQLDKFVQSTLAAIDCDAGISIDDKQKTKTKKLRQLRDTVLSLKLIQVVLGSEDDAYLIFETLNTRGKDLALSDLLKNQFTKLIKKKGAVDTAKEKWTRFLGAFEQSQADISPDVFITHYWNSRHEAITQKKVFKSFKKSLNTSNANDVLDSLNADVELYRMIFEPTYGWNKNERRIQETLMAFQLFRLSQPTPAILSLIRAYKDGVIKLKKIGDILESIENFHFIFTAVTSSRSSGGISAMYSSFGRKVFDCTDSQSVSNEIDELKAKLTDKRPSLSEFSASFSEIQFTNSLTKQKSLVQYILRKIAKKKGYSYPVDWSELTIEHIHPQNAIDEEWTDQIVGQIGNLMLVSGKLNNKLDDRDFASKKFVLGDATESIPDFVLNQEDWNVETVQEHTSEIAKTAYEDVWRI